jgi:cytochrome P450
VDAPLTTLAGTAFQTVSGYDQCVAILRDAERFPPIDRRTLQARTSESDDLPQPVHQAAVRTAAYQALAPGRRAEALTPDFQRIASEMIVSWEGSEIDLIDDYAIPYAVSSIGSYFGLRHAEWAEYERIRRGMLRPPAGGVPRPATASVRAWMSDRKFRHVVEIELADRRGHPRDDVLSALARAVDERNGLTESDILTFVPRLAFNATLGVSDLLGATLWRLLSCPHLTSAVHDNPTVVAALIEEVLRLEAPVRGVSRSVAVDTDLGTISLTVGSSLTIDLGAANRDASVFLDPDRLDLTRPNAHRHLGFGLGHEYCVGAPLARRAVSIAVDAVLRHWPSATLVSDQPIQRFPTPFNPGLRHLWAISGR